MKFLIVILIFFLVLIKADQQCTSDSSCEELSHCVNQKCIHKGLFPLATTEYVGTAAMMIISCIGNAGGIGGSAISISLMLLLFKFDAHSAVAMTQVFIFGGAAAAILLKFRDRHPAKDRPLIYYDVLMQIMGPILLGVSMGVMINPVFPEWLILLLLTLVVIYLLIDIIQRAKKIYRAEKSLPLIQDSQHVPGKFESLIKSFVSRVPTRKNIHTEGYESSREYENLTFSILLGRSEKQTHTVEEYSLNSIREETEDLKLSTQAVPPEIQFKIARIYENEKKTISCVPALYFTTLAVITINFSFLKGSSTSGSILGIESCSSEYFGLIVGYIILMIIMILISSFYLVKKTEICEQGNYQFDEGDVRWDSKKCFVIIVFGISAGTIVGLLGMGGGNIIGPLLLGLGIRPEIATISSSFSIFLSSGTAAAQFFIKGQIQIDYAGWFLGVSILGSLGGILVLRRYAIKNNKVSLLVFCLAAILFCSLIIIPTVGIMNALKQYNQGTLELGFSSLC